MPNKVLKVLFLYNGIFVLAGSLLGPLYALYVENLNVGILPISISWSAFLLSTTIFTFVISRLGDGFKHKRLLLAGGYLIRASCWLYMSVITNIGQLIITQFILGIGEALGTPAFDAIFAEHLDKNKHIMDYSDWKMTSNAVLVLGTLLGGFIVSNFGFSTLLVGMSVLSLVSMSGVIANPCIDGKNHGGPCGS